MGNGTQLAKLGTAPAAPADTHINLQACQQLKTLNFPLIRATFWSGSDLRRAWVCLFVDRILDSLCRPTWLRETHLSLRHEGCNMYHNAQRELYSSNTVSLFRMYCTLMFWNLELKENTENYKKYKESGNRLPYYHVTRLPQESSIVLWTGVFSNSCFKMEYPLFIYWQFHSCEQCALIITPSFPLPLPHIPPTCPLPTSCLLLFASVTHPDQLELPALMLTDLGGLILCW